MGRKPIDRTGEKINYLTFIKLDHMDEKKQAVWLCKCDCGNFKLIRASYVVSEKAKACGCLQGKSSRKWKYSTDKKLYKKWSHMKSRCYTKSDISYLNYGGRNIKVCEQWKNSFDSFAIWSYENGYKHGLELDRIDVNGNYEPTNCRYITGKENRRNKRTTQKYFYKNKKRSLGEIAEINGIKYKTMWQRINRDGRTLEKALCKQKIC